ncbi:hypothetical protein AYO20_00374 [Fonsecaea nubica]|uniref:Uncharacterized protein n=1 Tax=Fonsecaea nubica TaxID=856822 RepID=A0A178DF53_9EURO|nr:hypothetical protein AYO20_00374 [Fonsecaea nubica]OAL40638.1 hypothetical protein AYO20_00374 [Fonsecaea nubica]
MHAIPLLVVSLTTVGAVHLSHLDNPQQHLLPAAALTAPPEATATLSTLLPDGITADPKELQRRQKQETTFTLQTVYPGPFTWLTSLGSLCGFVASDVHWALYCDVGQYCITDDLFLQCCSTTSETFWMSTGYYTDASTGRNTLTTTLISTLLITMSSTLGNNCTAGFKTCYDYNATASCSDGCTSTALVCNNPYFPYCASLYSGGVTPSSVGTTSTYLPFEYGVSYFCDTEAYGLQYGDYGYWPSVTSTYFSVAGASTSTTPTFTPNVVPYSRTQATRPASQATLLAPTSTVSSATSSRPLSSVARMLGTVSLLALCYVLS